MSTSDLHHSPRSSGCPSRWSRSRVVASLVLVSVLLLASCSGDAGDDDSAGDAADVGEESVPSQGGGDDAATGEALLADESEAAVPDAMEAERSSADEGASPQSTSAGAPAVTPIALTPADLGRSIVYTATVELQAPDVAAAGAEARQVIGALGGVVFGQESTTDPQPRTVLVFKVGPDQFQPALDALSAIGDVIRRDVSADDVTERIVDLQSQISSAEVSVARLRDLLDDAQSIEAVAALEAQLLQRETALEQMRGQLRTLEDQVALSTITVTITQPTATPVLAVATTAYAGFDDGARCPGADELTLDEGDDGTLCFTIENTGNVAVTELAVSDHRLGLDPDDVTLVDFAADDVLEPGDTIVAYAAFTPDVGTHPSPDVSAVPIDDAGTHLRVSVQTETTPIALTVDEDTSLPGFGDAIGAGLSALGMVVGIFLVAAGIALPFLVIGLPVAGAIIWWRRRNTSDTPPAPAG